MRDAYRQENVLCYKLFENKSFWYQFYKLDYFRGLCYDFKRKAVLPLCKKQSYENVISI